MKRRMGQDWRPNRAFSMDLLLEIFKRLEYKIENSDNKYEQHNWVIFQTYALVSYVLSLRGSEGLLLDLKSLIKHNMGKPEKDHIIITLLGKVKGESQDRVHIMPASLITKSGLKLGSSINRLITVKKRFGFTGGPAISDHQGRILSSRDLDGYLHDVLEEIHQDQKSLFPMDVTDSTKLKEVYLNFRSWRRTSRSRSVEEKVSESDVKMVNRWSKVEAAKGRKPSLSVPDLYTQVELIKKPFLRYTQAM